MWGEGPPVNEGKGQHRERGPTEASDIQSHQTLCLVFKRQRDVDEEEMQVFF